MSSRRMKLGLALGALAATLAAQLAPCLVGSAHAEQLTSEPTGMRPFRDLVIPTDEPSTPTADLLRGNTRRTLFFNRSGGIYVSGSNDSSTNSSSIIDGSRNLPPWNVSDTTWERFMDCNRRMWAPYNVVVTDNDPGAAAHIECVIGGSPGDAGMEPDVGGVSPGTCGIIERSIVYVFTDLIGNSPDFVCSVAAQEIAHSFSLDHQLACDDPMTYLEGCGEYAFRDRDVECGEFEPRECKCERGFTQNSHQMLLERLGVGDLIPPTATITSPAEGAAIKPRDQILVDAQDNNAILKVELWADGAFYGVDRTAPWAVRAANGLPPGPRALEIRVSDESGNIALASTTVMVSAECDETAQTGCDDDETCAGGLCRRKLGEECEAAEQCASGSCFVTEDQFTRVCSQECGDGLQACPAGFSCTEAGAAGSICTAGEGDGGGCGCQVGARAGAQWPAWLGFLSGVAIVATLARRRRRRGL